MFTPLLTQVHPTYFSVDCGMAYLMRLSDGRFVLIDSTFGEYDEVDRIYCLMREQNPEDEIPCVAAWFFTHPHSDHTRGFINMSNTYLGKVKVEKVIYSFPADLCEKTHDHLGFLKAIEAFGAEAVTPHGGDVLSFADAEFKVLFAEEDCPVRPVNVNETSLSMKMTLGNYTVMWLGDLQNVGSTIVMEKYSKDELKCDILQVGHHGYWGGSDALYRAVDPDTVIWPMPEFRYLDMLAEHCNRFFSDPQNNVRHIFVSGIEENTFDMTAPIEITTPYLPTVKIADFTQKSVTQLGWACVTGGGMGYTPSRLTFGENDCTLTTQSSRTLLQLIARGQIAVSDKYSLSFELIPKKECDILGLIYDCIKPTDPTSYEFYPISHSAGEKLEVTLDVDRNGGFAEICINGKCEKLPLRTAEPCPLILILNDAEVRITKAVFENK